MPRIKTVTMNNNPTDADIIDALKKRRNIKPDNCQFSVGDIVKYVDYRLDGETINHKIIGIITEITWLGQVWLEYFDNSGDVVKGACGSYELLTMLDKA